MPLIATYTNIMHVMAVWGWQSNNYTNTNGAGQDGTGEMMNLKCFS